MKIIAYLCLACALTGCASFEPKESKGNIVISLAGFYNSEVPPPEFKPGFIDYSAIVNYTVVFARLAAHAESLGYEVAPYEAYQSSFKTFNKNQTNQLSIVLKTVLAELNKNLLYITKGCPPCSSAGLSLPTELPQFSNWANSDRIVLVFGLETLNPNNRTLRAGLAAVAFDGNGKFIGYASEPHTFGKFNNEIMVKNASKLLAEVLEKKTL